MSDYDLQRRQVYATEDFMKATVDIQSRSLDMMERIAKALELNNIIMSQALAIMKEESHLEVVQNLEPPEEFITTFKTEVLDEV